MCSMVPSLMSKCADVRWMWWLSIRSVVHIQKRPSPKDINDVFPAERVSLSEMTVTHGKSPTLHFVTL